MVKTKKAKRAAGGKEKATKAARVPRLGVSTVQICARIPPAWLRLAGTIAKKQTPAVKRAAILREAIRLGLSEMTGKSVAAAG